MTLDGLDLEGIEADLRLLHASISREPWEVHHDAAMRCREFEEDLLKGILQLDHLVRKVQGGLVPIPKYFSIASVLGTSAGFSSEVLPHLQRMLASVCALDRVFQSELRAQEAAGFVVEGSQAFGNKLKNIICIVSEICDELSSNDKPVLDSNAGIGPINIKSKTVETPTAERDPSPDQIELVEYDLYLIPPVLPMPGPGVRVKARFVDSWPIDPPIIRLPQE